MAMANPILVFTRGVQRGGRVQLTKTMNVLGRDMSCDVVLQDEYVSRQHARIIIEDSRVRLVNTSPNGTKLNGKEVESADLKSGDLLGFGLECEVRFELAAPTEEARPAAPAAAAAAAAPGKPAAEPAEAPARRPRRRPTMIVWIGAYLLALALAVVVIRILVGVGDSDGPGRIGPPLSDEQIADIFELPLAEIPNDRQGDEKLREANAAHVQWQSGTQGPDQLYKILTLYKQALAFHNWKVFPRGDDVKRMEDVKNMLVAEVRIAYKNGYSYQRQGRWERAQAEYYTVLRLVPDFKNDMYRLTKTQLNMVQSALIRQKERASPKEW